MDFFLSKFINRSSPTPTNTEINSSNRIQSTNKENNDNKMGSDTSQNFNNHSNENYWQLEELKQNISHNPIENGTNIQKGSSSTWNGYPELTLNVNNGEYKAIEILHPITELAETVSSLDIRPITTRITPTEETSLDSTDMSVSETYNNDTGAFVNNDLVANTNEIVCNDVLSNDIVELSLESLRSNENTTENVRITTIDLSDIKILNNNIQSKPNDIFPISSTAAIQQTLIAPETNTKEANIENNFAHSTTENSTCNFNLQEMGLQEPHNIENFNEIIELLAQEGLLDEFSIATAIQYLNNTNQNSEFCEIESELNNDNQTESHHSCTPKNNINSCVQENFVVEMDENHENSNINSKSRNQEDKNQLISKDLNNLYDEIPNAPINKIEKLLSNQGSNELCISNTEITSENQNLSVKQVGSNDENSYGGVDEEIHKQTPSLALMKSHNVSLNDIFLINENLKEENQISAAKTELPQQQEQQQKSSASENILNTQKTTTVVDDINIKQEYVKQPTGTSVTTNDTSNIKSNDNSTIVNKQAQLRQEINVLKETEENIDPFEVRKFGDVSSLFSTPDSVSPNATFTEAILPDIINALPTITINGPGNDTLNISSLASHLNDLRVHDSVTDSNNLNATITKSNSSPSNISSDDELFAECESFPASANNSTTDFNVTNTIKTENDNNSSGTFQFNMPNDIEDSKSFSSIVSESNLIKTFTQSNVEIQLNQNVDNKNNKEILNKTLNLIPSQVENITVISNDLKKNLTAETEKAGAENESKQNEELKSYDFHEILEEKTPEDSLEYIPTDQNNILENRTGKQRANSHIEEDNLADSLNEIKFDTDLNSNERLLNNDLNVSLQWTDIVSSLNSNEQENLENSQIDLLNTTPQEIVDSTFIPPNNIEEKISNEEFAKETIVNLEEKETSPNITQNATEIQRQIYENEIVSVSNNNDIEIQINTNKLTASDVGIPTDLSTKECELTTSVTKQNDISEIENVMNTVSDMKVAASDNKISTYLSNKQSQLDASVIIQSDISKIGNITSTVSDIKLAIDSPNIIGPENIALESNLSNSRNSLNDIEVMNINRNISSNIQLNYSIDVTMEAYDEISSKIHDPKNGSKLSSDKTQNISVLNRTQDLSTSPRPANVIALNVTNNELKNDIQILDKKNLSLQSTSDNGLKRNIPKIEDQVSASGTLNPNVQLKTRNDAMVDNLHISKLNIEQHNNPKNENFITQNFSNIASQKLSTIICRHNDFEPMDVDISMEDQNQQQFIKLNNIYENTKIPSFSTLPSNFEMSTNIDEFKSIGNDNNVDLIFQSCDFEYLSKRGNNTVKDTRKDSLLLKFDPLLGKPLPVTTNLSNRPTILEEEDAITPNTSTTNNIVKSEKEFEFDSNNILINVPIKQIENLNKKQKVPTKLSINKKDIKTSTTSSSYTVDSPLLEEFEKLERKLELEEKGSVNNTMNVDVISNIKIDNDVQSNENINSNINSNEKHDLKMEDLEKKIKNEVLKTEDVEKKLKDAEQREEALLKRITDKDKTIAKMGGVIEAYEKAIAELIAEKEQITQNYEKQMEEIKAERDLNKQHLESLESTFTDLHVKYERSKQLLAKLKASEEELQAEKKRNLENLGLQEQRYEKMKNHAMQQLEIANNKLEHLTKNHQLEITKLKALLKKEEIAKSSVNEQLIQKSKENEELVKICEELINGGSTS